MVVRAAALVLALLLAGCADPAAPVVPEAEAPAEEHEGLYGIVFDLALRPLPGADVRLSPGGATVETDQEGRYGFPDAPRDVVLVVTASLQGYVAASRQTTLPAEGPVRLDLKLQPVPTTAGFVDVLKFDGLIGCGGALVLSESITQPVDCGAVDAGATVWRFSVANNLTTAVIEVAWTPATPLADGLGALLEEPGSQEPVLLAEKVGRSPLRLVVPQQTAARQFAGGGDLQLTVYPMPITDEDEQAAAAAFAFQQPFQAFASLFYGIVPDATYSFVEASG